MMEWSHENRICSPLAGQVALFFCPGRFFEGSGFVRSASWGWLVTHFGKQGTQFLD